MIPAYGNPQDFARQADGIFLSHLVNGGVPHSDSLAKYAAAFFKISRSMRSKAFSLRSLASSASCALELDFAAKAAASCRYCATQLEQFTFEMLFYRERRNMKYFGDTTSNHMNIMGFPKGVTQGLCPRPPLAAGGIFDF